MRKTLEPHNLIAIVDSREQKPWNLSPLRSRVGTLQSGDYSIAGLETEISLERKSLDDLIQCVGRHRDRFDRECERLLAFPTRAIIVEATWKDIETGNWRSKVKPAAALGSVLGWIAMGIPIIFAGNAEAAATYAGRLMFIAARRRYRSIVNLEIA